MRLLLLLAALLCAAAQDGPDGRAYSRQMHRRLRDGGLATAVGAPAPAAARVASASVALINACRQQCPSAFQPVCGGKSGTYLNACWAACMGAEPFAVGDCDVAADRFQRSMGSGCEQRCSSKPGSTAAPGAGPVCAENGFTFTSACVANCSNVATTAGACCASYALASLGDSSLLLTARAAPRRAERRVEHAAAAAAAAEQERLSGERRGIESKHPAQLAPTTLAAPRRPVVQFGLADSRWRVVGSMSD